MRTDLMKYLNENGIKAVFIMFLLHSSLAGKKYGEFVGEDINTTKKVIDY